MCYNPIVRLATQEYRALLERLAHLAAEAAMEGVALIVPADPALEELERLYSLEQSDASNAA